MTQCVNGEKIKAGGGEIIKGYGTLYTPEKKNKRKKRKKEKTEKSRPDTCRTPVADGCAGVKLRVGMYQQTDGPTNRQILSLSHQSST